MKTYFPLVLLLALLMPLATLADDNVLRLTGSIRERGSDAYLPNTHWTVYDSLDCVVDSASFSKWSPTSKSMIESAFFSVSVPRVDATYRLVFAKEGYDTTECYYRVEKIGRRELSRPIGAYYLSRTRDAIQLNQVTVTASKIKFYNRGDTIVFNADAFLLSDGSMLDELIRQLPGVELKPNGKIYVNGRYVESLLLNGKEFFKGNNKVMLENLGAYTVKNIEVYEKRGQLSEFLNRDLASDKEYVMDVKLKKEYNYGWIINAEGGYGTSDRYLGRLFGMHYNSHNRFTITGNVNNLGSEQRAGQDNGLGFMSYAGDFSSGRSELIDGGFDYMVDKGKIEFYGNANVRHRENNTITTTTSANFLPQGNNYSYTRSNSKSNNLNIDTWHRISNSNDYIYWQFSPSYRYSHSDGNSANAQAMYNSELTGEQWMSVLDRLMAGDVTPEMRDSLINQSLRTSGNSSISQSATAYAQGHVKIRGTSDWISASLNTNYNYSHTYAQDRYLINYGDASVPGLGQRQRTVGRPNRQYSIDGNVTYNYVFNSKTSMSLKYEFREDWHEQTSNLYLAQIQADATGRFDLLALEQIKETLDANNSYVSNDHTSTHNIIPNLEHQFKLSDCKGSLSVNVPMQILTKRLDYTRGSIDVDPRHTWCLVNDGSILLRLNKKTSKGSDGYYASYSLSMSAPDLMRMIDIVNDADPLNIYLGNPGLRPTLSHRISISASHFANNSQTVNGGIGGTYQQRGIASGYTFDSTTGVRCYKAYNVGGDWDVHANCGYNGTYGKGKQWMTSVNAFGSYAKYINMISYGTGEPQPSDAHSLSVNLMAYTSFQSKGFTTTVGFSGSWTRSRNSGLSGSAPNNVGNANPYISMRVNLPARVFIQTQLQMYNRFGMSDPALSKPKWVWVASLSYSPTKSCTILLDGFDILRQLSPAQVSVNALGRFEVYGNTLPSYFMARVQYRISISPKKETAKPSFID